MMPTNGLEVKRQEAQRGLALHSILLKNPLFTKIRDEEND